MPGHAAISAALRDQAAAWIADDPDPRDQAELQALLDDGGPQAAADLASRMAGRLEFGTAGLRGAVGAGPNRMNRAVVRGTTAALADWLLRRTGGEAARQGVVIGCDARHRSEEFAAEAARVLAGAGIAVHLLPPRQPTPLLAFCVRWRQAAAGVMITASHNPPADNGYKLYDETGAQIVPPADAEIEAAIAALGPLAQVPVAGLGDPLISRPGDEAARSYLAAICPAAGPGRAGGGGPGSGPGGGLDGTAWLRFTYTPLHGVAAELAQQAFERAGFSPPDLVTAQIRPDPDFPTVRFPNPEEPGALDLALALARRTSADLVIANDPDGDRLAVAVPGPGGSDGWQALTGDQVGALLGAYLLEQVPAGDRAASLVVTTIVSSTLLSRIAAAAGARFAQTLTGFKWIVRAGDHAPQARFAFGYEEALGYCVGTAVRDKDGISAALAVLRLAAAARSAGRSLREEYDALEERHGVHLTGQLTVASRTPAEVMARLRGDMPAELGGQPVTGITDFTGGAGGLPSADVLRYQLPGGRAVIRPSGTEPKIKAYLEVVEPVPPGQLAAARAAAQARMEPLREAVAALLAG